MIEWIPFLVLLVILALFKSYSIANRYYPLFLFFICCSGFAIVFIYKYIFKLNAHGEINNDNHK